MNKIKLPRNHLRGNIKVGSFNEADNTIEVVFTKGSRGIRSTWFGDRYFEELAVDEDSMSLERFNAHASVLDSHNSYGLRNVLGVVEKAWIEGDAGVARIRLSDREDVKGITQDIKGGIIRNVSVGYQVDLYEELEETEDDLPIYRAVKWEPFELSFVSVPFDRDSQSRSAQKDEQFTETLIQKRERDTMKTKKKPADLTAEGAVEGKKIVKAEEIRAKKAAEKVKKAPKIAEKSEEDEDLEDLDDDSEEIDETEEDSEEVESTEEDSSEDEGDAPSESTRSLDADQIRQKEITRGLDIRKNVRLAGLDEDFAEKLIANPKMTVERAGKAIFAEMATRDSTPTNNQRSEISIMDNQKIARREAATRGLLNRAFGDTIAPLKDTHDNQFRQGSIMLVARQFLHLEGVKDAFSMSNKEVAKRSLMSTSDFPLVLENIATKSLLQGYEAVPQTFLPFVRERTVDNFKEIAAVGLSKGGRLKEVNEAGEYEHDALIETGERYKVKKYGKIIGKTWELMINDDLGALTDNVADMGQRARELENILFWNQIIANPVMAEDGNAFFHANHGNLVGSGTVINVANLGIMRAKARVLKDLDGELINLNPNILVVPAALEMVAEQYIAQVTPNINGSVNPFAGKLDLVVEPLLDAASVTAWYMMVSKQRLAWAEMARLNGNGPEIFTKEGFDVDGHEIKVRHVVGVKLLNFRGAQKNVGA